MKIQELIGEIGRVKKDGNLIIVEGDHDKAALQELGLQNIFVINRTGVSLYAQIEAVTALLQAKKPAAKAVILTDLDKKGRFLYKFLRKHLTDQGIRINDNLRRALIRAKVSHVEGLATFYQNSLQSLR